jgi:hypothetical protein
VIVEWIGFLAALFTLLAIGCGIIVVVDLALWRWKRRTGRKRPVMWRSGVAVRDRPSSRHGRHDDRDDL